MHSAPFVQKWLWSVKLLHVCFWCVSVCVADVYGHFQLGMLLPKHITSVWLIPIPDELLNDTLIRMTARAK